MTIPCPTHISCTRKKSAIDFCVGSFRAADFAPLHCPVQRRKKRIPRYRLPRTCTRFRYRSTASAKRTKRGTVTRLSAEVRETTRLAYDVSFSKTAANIVVTIPDGQRLAM